MLKYDKLFIVLLFKKMLSIDIMEVLLSENNSQLCYIPNILTEDECEYIKKLAILEEEMDSEEPYLLYHPPVVLYGRVCHQQRSVGFFTNDKRVKGYRYSKRILKSQNMPEYMASIMAKVNRVLNHNFNAILLNHYANGKEYISAHSDSQIGLKTNIVASISVGEDRIFRIRDKETNNVVLDVPTYERGLLLMIGDFQQHYTHEIPVDKRITMPRWSLTFRTHSF